MTCPNCEKLAALEKVVERMVLNVELHCAAIGYKPHYLDEALASLPKPSGDGGKP